MTDLEEKNCLTNLDKKLTRNMEKIFTTIRAFK